MIGAALFAALTNVAAASTVQLRGPVGYKNFFKVEGYTLNPSIKVMELLIVPQMSCESMTAFFSAENDGIVEQLEGFIEMRNTEPGRKHRQTIDTDLKPGGSLIIESIRCRNRTRDDQSIYLRKR